MKTFIMVLLLATFVGCGDASPTNESGVYTGTLIGTAGGTTYNHTVSAILAKSNTTKDTYLDGTWSSSSGATGMFHASATGPTSYAAAVKQDGDCTGTFNGALTVADGKISGILSGDASKCGAFSAQINLNKQ